VVNHVVLQGIALRGPERRGLGDGALDERGVFGRRALPADDQAGEGVDHERGVTEPGQRADVGEIGHQQGVRRLDSELPVDQVRCPGPPGSAIVVRTFLALVAPRQPFTFISRSMVQRATWMPWRCRWAHIFNDPYSDSGGRRPSASGS
jgi:hypothetical protein